MKDFDPTAGEFISSGFLRYSNPRAPQPRHYLPEAVVTAMMVGAAVGAVTAAITGGNILKGALFGAIGGGISSALTSALGAAASSTASAATSGVAGEAVAGVAGEALAGAGATAGIEGAAAGAMGDAALASSAGALESGIAMGGAEAAGAAATGIGEAASAATGTVGTGMQQAIDYSIGGGMPGGTGLSAPGVDSGLAANPTDMRLAAGTQTSPLGGTVAGGDSGSFLDQLLNKGKGMLNSRFVTGMAGNALQGMSAGRMQEAKIAEERRRIEEARANARFGNVGSRYGGMIYANPTYK